MNFKGHAFGGAVVSATYVGSLYVLEQIQLDSPAIEFEGNVPILSPSALNAAYLFLICFFMSLFPDLDTDSMVKRWYYRFLLIASLLLVYYKEKETALFILILSLLPLLDKHRGWTHWKIAPLLTGVLLPIAYAAITLDVFDDYFMVAKFVWNNAGNYIHYFGAIFIGHAAHLIFDSKLFIPKT